MNKKLAALVFLVSGATMAGSVFVTWEYWYLSGEEFPTTTITSWVAVSSGVLTILLAIAAQERPGGRVSVPIIGMGCATAWMVIAYFGEIIFASFERRATLALALPLAGAVVAIIAGAMRWRGTPEAGNPSDLKGRPGLLWGGVAMMFGSVLPWGIASVRWWRFRLYYGVTFYLAARGTPLEIYPKLGFWTVGNLTLLSGLTLLLMALGARVGRRARDAVVVIALGGLAAVLGVTLMALSFFRVVDNARFYMLGPGLPVLLAGGLLAIVEGARSWERAQAGEADERVTKRVVVWRSVGVVALVVWGVILALSLR